MVSHGTRTLTSSNILGGTINVARIIHTVTWMSAGSTSFIQSHSRTVNILNNSYRLTLTSTGLARISATMGFDLRGIRRNQHHVFIALITPFNNPTINFSHNSFNI